MKGATQCAKKLSSLFRNLRTRLGKPGRPPEGDPIAQLILGVFSRDVPESKAREAHDRLRALVVDYNDLRVIPPSEIGEAINSLPESRVKSEDLSRALNRIFAIEHTVTLERCQAMARKDQLAYLANIDGLEAYSRARIRLFGFQEHAIPLDEAMWAVACDEGIVDPKSTLDEAQSFLERQVSSEDAVEFVLLLKKHAWTEAATRVRKGDVPRIRSVPPDRTSRNMLRQIIMMNAEPGTVDAIELEFGDEALEALPSEPEAAPAPRRRGSKAKSEAAGGAGRKAAAAAAPRETKRRTKSARTKSAS